MIVINRLPIAFVVGAVLVAAACSSGTGNLGTVPPVPTPSASVDPGPDMTPQPSGAPSEEPTSDPSAQPSGGPSPTPKPSAAPTKTMIDTSFSIRTLGLIRRVGGSGRRGGKTLRVAVARNRAMTVGLDITASVSGEGVGLELNRIPITSCHATRSTSADISRRNG